MALAPFRRSGDSASTPCQEMRDVARSAARAPTPARLAGRARNSIRLARRITQDTARPEQVMHHFSSLLARLQFSTIQIGLVLFWAMWLTAVAATNILDALKQLGALPARVTLVCYKLPL